MYFVQLRDSFPTISHGVMEHTYDILRPFPIISPHCHTADNILRAGKHFVTVLQRTNDHVQDSVFEVQFIFGHDKLVNSTAMACFENLLMHYDPS